MYKASGFSLPGPISDKTPSRVPSIRSSVQRNMKSRRLALLFCAILAVSSVSAQIEESEDDVIYKAEYCRTTEVLKNRCQIEKCNQEDTRYLVIGCPTFKCSDKILGTRQDASKPYPHCCPVPDCS
ncbi:uncharacterized protein LOC106660182 isoform X1 [Trichogramma pretiosum]|uniref:Single domain-containing protein n=1 Tax=Trichogramma kaykai TaxID=54128 RepID=A0ABD2X494_9HYME|nr:uncharacterized protein LOC106660182 isoform X1 [Trichogramma pretiosum]